MIINNIKNEIMKSNSIAITFHTSPDGDSIGSALGLYFALRKINKEVSFFVAESLSSNFNYLPGFKELLNAKATVEDIDLLIVLDCGDVKRINAVVDLKDRDYRVINMDHHITNEMYGDINYVDSKKAAVSEIIYELIKEMEIELDKDIAFCLYTSLISDTGSFKFQNTTGFTHFVAQKLIETGIDFPFIHRMVFENKKYEEIKLLGMALNNINIYEDKIALCKIKTSLLKELGLDESVESFDILNSIMQINTVEVVVLLKETENGIKASLRSKNYVDVRKISEIYGGGGHIRAAGFKTTIKDISDLELKLIKEIKKWME